MQNEKEIDNEEGREPLTRRPSDEEPVEEREHPVPGIKHEHEPDAENIMPAEDRPGTL